MDHQVFKGKVADASNAMFFLSASILTAEIAVCSPCERLFTFSTYLGLFNELSRELDMLAPVANVFEWSFEGGHHNWTLLPGVTTP